MISLTQRRRKGSEGGKGARLERERWGKGSEGGNGERGERERRVS